MRCFATIIMNRRPDHRHYLRSLFPMIQVSGLGVILFAGVGTFLALPINAQTERSASFDQQSAQYSEAFENWMLLAIEGDAEAQFNLGLLYSEGKGVPVDYRQAAFWYRKGAEQGHTGAQYNLAHLYLDGHGVDKDPVKATHWWQQAAQRGHVLAQQYLGYAYYKGIGVNKDQQEALRWFREAAKGGDWRAEKMLATIEQTLEPAPKTAKQQGTQDESALKDIPQPVPGQPPAPPSEQTELQARTASTPAPAPVDQQSAPDEQAPVAFAPDPHPGRSKPLAPTARQADDATTIAASQEPILTRATDEQPTSPSEPATVSPKSGPDSQPATQQPWVLTAAPADGQATTSRGPQSGATKEQIVSADAQPVIAQPDRKSGPSELPVAAAESKDDKVDAEPEREPEVIARPPATPKADPVDISATPRYQGQAGATKPLPPETETAGRLQLEPPLSARLSAPEQARLTASPASVTDNDRWLFTQPPDFYTLQLISAPRRATVAALIRQQGLKNVRLMRTQVNGVRWWYLLSGSYPNREQANAAASVSTVEQSNIWLRRFGTLQENRCKNLSVTGLSAFCDGPRPRVTAAGRRGRLETGERRASVSEPSVALIDQPVASAPAEPPASTEPQQAPTGSMVAAELLTVAGEKQTAIAGLRHDDNAWLFAQPEDHYTVQLVSMPDVSQVERFLRDNKLQDKAIYYTTRREQKDWYIAIYGSHPDLDTAKQATKALPVASGSVWIRQFDAIQKRQCQVANQLPAGVSATLNFYCRP